jgi:hypothetical protein
VLRTASSGALFLELRCRQDLSHPNDSGDSLTATQRGRDHDVERRLVSRSHRLDPDVQSLARRAFRVAFRHVTRDPPLQPVERRAPGQHGQHAVEIGRRRLRLSRVLKAMPGTMFVVVKSLSAARPAVARRE